MSAEQSRVFVSFVLYVRGVGGELADFLRTVDAFLNAAFEHHEIILVDDASAHNTDSTLSNLDLKGPLTVLRFARPQGEEAAVLAGLALTTGDWVFDSSFETADWPADFLGEMYQTAAVGTDIVAAVGRSTSWLRKRVFEYASRHSRVSLSPDPEPLRLVSRRALNALLDLTEKVRFRRVHFAVIGYSSCSLRYEPRTQSNKHRLGRPSLVRLDNLIAFSDVGLRLPYLLAFFFAGVTALIGLYSAATLVLKLEQHWGFSLLGILTTSGLTLVFLTLGILGEYLSRMLLEVRGRPTHDFAQTTVINPAKRSPETDPPLAALSKDWTKP